METVANFSTALEPIDAETASKCTKWVPGIVDHMLSSHSILVHYIPNYVQIYGTKIPMHILFLIIGTYIFLLILILLLA